VDGVGKKGKRGRGVMRGRERGRWWRGEVTLFAELCSQPMRCYCSAASRVSKGRWCTCYLITYLDLSHTLPRHTLAPGL
jgi:hypothetical protein